jgi:hypothetical protein
MPIEASIRAMEKMLQEKIDNGEISQEDLEWLKKYNFVERKNNK